MTTQGSGPLVVLVHGFPEFWWGWRDQIQPLVEAGYRVAAVDLRGFGASDKPPTGYDPVTATEDLAALIRSLGSERAAIVGHDLGAWFAWSMATLQPQVTAAIGVLSMPHPLVFYRASWSRLNQWRANTYIRAMQSPFAPERQLSPRRQVIARRLHEWSGPDRSWLTDETVARYVDVMAVPFAATAAAEYYRWLFRSRVSVAGVRYLARMRAAITVPVLQIHGSEDPVVLPSVVHGSGRYVDGPWQLATLPGVGHFPAEEDPGAVSDLLTSWLTSFHPA